MLVKCYLRENAKRNITMTRAIGPAHHLPFDNIQCYVLRERFSYLINFNEDSATKDEKKIEISERMSQFTRNSNIEHPLQKKKKPPPM